MHQSNFKTNIPEDVSGDISGVDEEGNEEGEKMMKKDAKSEFQWFYTSYLDDKMIVDGDEIRYEECPIHVSCNGYINEEVGEFIQNVNEYLPKSMKKSKRSQWTQIESNNNHM